MRTTTPVLCALIITLTGCSTVHDPVTDTGGDIPTDAADTSGEVDVLADVPDVADTAPEPDAAVDPVEEPVEEALPDTFDVLDPPRDPIPEPEPDPDLPPDTWIDAPLDGPDPRPDISIDYPVDPAGDCSAGTCTDYYGRRVCVGGSGLIACPTDPRCLMLCVCDAPGTWGICMMPCIC
ncbi:MAG: hypothetical protein JRG91_14810 [Deltaproteobacteria bacterium]|nr:hypothetical protein [Deltaproteobacteria bacterium]